MKRLIVFSICLILVSFFSLAFLKIAANADTELNSNSSLSTSSAVATSTPSINYDLPYPGMLPDNPLYFLKVARDAIVKLLIIDPLKKAQFSLLTAEKRMYAGQMLVTKGKQELALDTIEKGNNYIYDALSAIRKAKAASPKNPGIQSFLSQSKTAVLKNEEILKNLEKQIDSKYQEKLKIEEGRLVEYGKEIDALSANKK